MKLKINLLLNLFLSCTFSLVGQDLHFTNNSFAPLFSNPANTGDFYGSYRFGLILRDQMRSFSLGTDANGNNVSFLTPCAYIDSPISKGLFKNHWVGAGINFSYDKAGDLGLKNTDLSGNFAYHIGWGTGLKQNISFGISLGQISRSLPNADKAILPNYETNPQSPDKALITGFKGSAKDYSAGINFDRTISDYSKFNLGFSALHISQPKIRFSNGKSDNKIPIRYNAYASYGIDISDEISLIPRIYFSTAEKNMNTNLQMLLDYRFFQYNDEKLKTKIPSNKIKSIQLGLGYRIKDAMQIIFDVNFKDWVFGAAYDFTVSQAAAFDNNFGGIEFGIHRIFVVPKKPKVKPKVFCPRF